MWWRFDVCGHYLEFFFTFVATQSGEKVYCCKILNPQLINYCWCQCRDFNLEYFFFSYKCSEKILRNVIHTIWTTFFNASDSSKIICIQDWLKRFSTTHCIVTVAVRSLTLTSFLHSLYLLTALSFYLSTTHVPFWKNILLLPTDFDFRTILYLSCTHSRAFM